MDLSFWCPLVIPVLATALGALLFQFRNARTLGWLCAYFGMQSFTNLYMKAVLSNVEISLKPKLSGIPAPFLILACQQAVSLCICILWFLVSRALSRPYTPMTIDCRHGFSAVLGFSLFFVLNFGLNNYSLSLVAISVNMMMRSCLPLVTHLVLILWGYCLPHPSSGSSGKSGFGYVLFGVFCAVMVVYVQSRSRDSSYSDHFELGIFVAGLALIAAAANFVLAGHLGYNFKLSVLDTIFYMSLPSICFLLLAALIPHPVNWVGYGTMTDYAVMLKAIRLQPISLLYVLTSGLVALPYNMFQYALVNVLSATHMTFAGNFNKVATVSIALLMGLEPLPAGALGVIMVLALLGNASAFTGYSLLEATSEDTQQSDGESEVEFALHPRSMDRGTSFDSERSLVMEHAHSPEVRSLRKLSEW